MPHIEKVTAFITRYNATELLLFEHPFAGIQIPAGTVEVGEAIELAALREAREESGLNDLHLRAHLGTETIQLADDQRMIACVTKAYARPDLASFDWVQFRRGIQVCANRRANGMTQVTYELADDSLNPTFTTFHITAWVPDDALAETITRHFYHLEFRGDASVRWTVQTDQHTFTPFWARRDALPIIHPHQAAWLRFFSI